MENNDKWSRENLEKIVKQNFSYAGILRDLNLEPKGGNYPILKKKIKEYNIDVSHLTGKAWNQGERFQQFHPVKSLKDILIENSSYSNMNKLRQRLIKEGYKSNCCEKCKRTEWEGYPIPLELHHINGIREDLRIENLQILCPNCHALTDNYRGKGLKLNNLRKNK